MLPASADILALHDRHLTSADRAPAALDALWSAIEENHRRNGDIWQQEDLARRPDVADSEIAQNKRTVDLHNQKRNDAIERIDELILESLQSVPRKPHARMNSETAGSMIDRLSVLALRIHHMRIQTERRDVDRTSHRCLRRQACAAG